MQFSVEPYALSILVLGLTGGLSLLQLIVFDVMAIKLKHPPGYPVENSLNNLLFRLSRAHANTNETLGAMTVLLLFNLLLATNPYWVNLLMVIYFFCRVMHMVFYYLGWGLLRGLIFGISLFALIGLFVLGLMNWFS